MALVKFKIDSLEITRFRGVPDTITVPLGAPLTLIYAANGTGKSTVCQAVEWLLTGRIEGIEDDAITCKWGASETCVSAIGSFDDKPLKLIRTFDGLSRESAGKLHEVDTLKFLKALTPDNLAVSSRSDYAIKERSSWLRGTRWLYSTALGLLIDDDHLDKREQIFADILGYGHLTPVRRKIKAYWDALPSYRGLESNIKKIELQMESAKKDISSAGPTAFDTSIELAYSILNIKEAEGVEEHNQRLDAVNAAISGAEHRLASVSSQFINLSGGLQSAELTYSEIKNLRGLISEAINRNKSVEERVNKVASDLSQKNTESSDGQILLKNLELLCEVLIKANEVYSDMEDLEESISSDITVSELKENLPEAFWTKSEIFLLISAVDEFSNVKQDFIDLRKKYSELNKVILQRPAATQLSEASAEVTNYRELNQKAISELAAISSSLDELRRLGQGFVHEHEELKSCPLCGVEQPTHDKLLRLIGVAMSTVAPSVAVLQVNVKRTGELLTSAEKKHSEIAAVEMRATLAQRELSDVEEKLKEMISQSPFDELTLESIDQFSVDSIYSYEHRLSVSKDVNELYSTIRQVEKKFELVTAEKTFSERVSQASNTVKIFIEKQKSSLSKVDRELLGLKSNLTKEEQLRDREARDLKNLEERLSALLLSKTEFSDACKILKVSEPPTSQELERVAQLISDRRQKLDLSKEQVSIASTSIKSGIAFKELNRLTVECNRLKSLLDQAKSCTKRAERVYGIYDSHIKELTKSQLAPLMEPAQQLFSRMHANEVYKGIGVDSEEGRLIWSGVADDLTVNAGAMFSQGQRQDLALSLYLSRAMSMGGMFFLDEPIAHLDDLNRVAMLDIFRVLAVSEKDTSLVLTTSSDSLMRHVTQKFSSALGGSLLNVVTLKGNPRTGVTLESSIDK
ncbi:hypothetical protein [Pseudomonas sp. CF10PS3]